MKNGRSRAVPSLLILGLVSAVLGLLANRATADRNDARADMGQSKSTSQVPVQVKSPTTQPAADATAIQVKDETAGDAHLVSGLAGSKHDFRKLNETVRDLCLPCHTPHLVSAPTPRLDRRPPTTQPLRPYQDIGVELSGWSLLCLGCHDGVTAPDVYSSAHAVTVADQLANSRLGTVGLRSHPVGVRYPTVDRDYEPVAAVEASGLPLPDGRIQCTTCHDAHNTYSYAGMLRISNQRSQLCLSCHRR